MKRFALALCLAPGLASAAQITALPPNALEWTLTPEGVAFAPLSGDRFVESYLAMVSLPAGLVSPAHRKSADMFGLVVSGTMTHVSTSADSRRGLPLGPGSYYHIPADLAHVSSCISNEDCVTLLYQPGAFDFLPVAP